MQQVNTPASPSVVSFPRSITRDNHQSLSIIHPARLEALEAKLWCSTQLLNGNVLVALQKGCLYHRHWSACVQVIGGSGKPGTSAIGGKGVVKWSFGGCLSFACDHIGDGQLPRTNKNQCFSSLVQAKLRSCAMVKAQRRFCGNLEWQIIIDQTSSESCWSRRPRCPKSFSRGPREASGT
jgi:hypothetical protein